MNLCTNAPPHAHTRRTPRALRGCQTGSASACYVQATAKDQQTEPSPRYVPNFVRKALRMDNRRSEAHVVPGAANVAAAVLPQLSQTPLPPQATARSVSNHVVRMKEFTNTAQYRVFCADSPRRHADTDQIALGGRSAVWHVLITRRRSRDTRVFLPPLLACACDACVRKSGCWRLESAIPGADVRAAAGVLQAPCLVRPCAVQYSRTTKQLVGRRLWTRPTRTAPAFWLREVGFPRPTRVMS